MKIDMKIKKKIVSSFMCGALILSNLTFAFADGADVVTIGANLNAQQRQTVLDYFGVKENEVVIVEVNNQEERKYLSGVATEAQLGKQTYSCSYVQPTESGKGLHVKVSNLTFLNSSMLSSVLVSLGVYDANVVAMSPIGPISGTGALTGVMKAFESASGEELDEDKKEIASEELIVTGDIGQDIGQDKATGIINDIKTEVIKNNTSDTIQIADTINNVTNNYNVTLTDEQISKITSLMEQISKQDYNYNEMKSSLKYVSSLVDDNLKALGEKVDRGFFTNIFESIKGFFSGLFEKEEDLGIIKSTNDSLLGDNAVIDATDKNAINLPSSEEVEGFFTKIWNWFTGLFNNSKNVDSNENTDNNTTNSDNSIIENSNPQVEDNNTTTNHDVNNSDTSDSNIGADSNTGTGTDTDSNTDTHSSPDNLGGTDTNTTNDDTNLE